MRDGEKEGKSFGAVDNARDPRLFIIIDCHIRFIPGFPIIIPDIIMFGGIIPPGIPLGIPPGIIPMPGMP